MVPKSRTLGGGGNSGESVVGFSIVDAMFSLQLNSAEVIAEAIPLAASAVSLHHQCTITHIVNISP